jgi:hypothetical protein
MALEVGARGNWGASAEPATLSCSPCGLACMSAGRWRQRRRRAQGFAAWPSRDDCYV